MMVANRLLKGVPDLQVMFFHGLAGTVVSTVYLLVDCHIREDFGFFGQYTPWTYFLLFTGSLWDPLCVYSGLKAA